MEKYFLKIHNSSNIYIDHNFMWLVNNIANPGSVNNNIGPAFGELTKESHIMWCMYISVSPFIFLNIKIFYPFPLNFLKNS